MCSNRLYQIPVILGAFILLMLSERAQAAPHVSTPRLLNGTAQTVSLRTSPKYHFPIRHEVDANTQTFAALNGNWMLVETMGWHLLEETGNAIAGLNEANNVISQTVMIRIPYIDLSIPEETLEIDDVLFVEHLTEISVRVLNDGEQGVSNVEVRFYDGNPDTGGTQIGATQVITEIAPYEYGNLQLSWKPMNLGTIRIYVVVDANNLISETDETNNVVTRTVEVRPLTLTWYVDDSVTTSGDGRSLQTAFKTIREAMGRTVSGDTVRVVGGTYIENIVVPPGVHLVGEGFETTTIMGTGSEWWPIVTLSAQTVISGFTIMDTQNSTHYAAINIIDGDVTVEKNHITQNSSGVYIDCSDPKCGSPITVTHNIIDNNQTGLRVTGNVADNVTIAVRNNTVVSNSVGIYIGVNANALIENNIVVRNRASGITAESFTEEPRPVDEVDVRYNNIWNNGLAADYAGVQLGEGSISADPLFRDLRQDDYHLTAISPAIGQGIPAGTDMGFFPFVAAGPTPQSFVINQLKETQWQATWHADESTGYMLHLGIKPGEYLMHFDVHKANQYLLEHLPGGITYYAVLNGYNNLYQDTALSNEVSFTTPTSVGGIYQESTPGFIYGGEWKVIADERASGGQIAISETPGNQVSILFNGERIVIYRTLDVDGGEGRVTIDGVYVGRLRFDFHESRWQVPAFFDDLGEGPHILTIRHHGVSDADRVQIDSFQTLTPYQPTIEQIAAIERINLYRQAVKLPLTKGVQAIHMGAQSHAEYYITNKGNPLLDGLGAHGEHSTLPGFIGESPGDRAAYFGYPGGVGEDMHFLYDVEGSVNGWMETVYHRNLIMGYGAVEAGYGIVNDYRGNVNVLNMGSREFLQPNGKFIYTYPIDGQKDVPHIWSGLEIPDPLPNVEEPVGYPISIYIIPDSNTNQRIQRPLHSLDNATDDIEILMDKWNWQLDLAELRDASGSLVPAYILDTESDRFLKTDVVFLISRQPLKLNHTYTVKVSGTDSIGDKFSHTWTFTTEPAAAIHSVTALTGACGVTISALTADPASATLQFGSTSGKLAGPIPPSTVYSGKRFDFSILNLESNQTYYYQVSTIDAQGHHRASDVKSFRTRSPQTIRVPIDYKSIYYAVSYARPCDIVSVEPGEYQTGRYFFVPPGVHLVGAGPEQTKLMGIGSGNVIHVGNQTILSGFTIANSGKEFWDTAIWIADNSSPVITNNHIHSNSIGITSYCHEPPCTNRPRIQNNVIFQNSNAGIVDAVGGSTIMNNTIVDNQDGIRIDAKGDSVYVQNNLLISNRGIGIHLDNGDVYSSYNNIWDNDKNYSDVQPGQGDISADPLFIDKENRNYRLQPNSPSRDAGDPSQAYQDHDGTRSDMGAYGGNLLSSNLLVSITSLPSPTLPEQQVDVQIHLMNPGLVAKTATIRAIMPPGTEIIPESVTATSGHVTLNDGQILINDIRSLFNTPNLIRFSVQTNLSLEEQPAVLRIPVSITWDGGQIETEAVSIINGMKVHLPLVMR